MLRVFQALLLTGVLALSACGGGSSSGGGGSGETYTGTYTANLGAGLNSAKDTGAFTATVAANAITITFDDGTEFTGGLSPTGTASPSRSIVGAIEGCTAGTIDLLVFVKPEEGTISGAISGKDIVCDGASFMLTGTLKGIADQ